jgi:hypothetical protein
VIASLRPFLFRIRNIFLLIERDNPWKNRLWKNQAEELQARAANTRLCRLQGVRSIAPAYFYRTRACHLLSPARQTLSLNWAKCCWNGSKRYCGELDLMCSLSTDRIKEKRFYDLHILETTNRFLLGWGGLGLINAVPWPRPNIDAVADAGVV